MCASAQPLRVAILGCSGSIGTQALDVCRLHADKIKVCALSVYDSVDFLVSAAREFDVCHVAIANQEHASDAVLNELPNSCEIGFGASAVSALAQLDDVDCVLNALVGAAGIDAAYAALTAGKRLAYANKESIVVGGELLMPLAKPDQIIPVDSEHSAIFQSLVGENKNPARRIWLTCSGGPFFGRNKAELETKTAQDALAHPTWTMGEKITIDSATLMNKGLEVIEARHLFGVEIDDIEVLVHRESRIHSMVEFSDGSVKAQLGPTDMRIPIQYAFSYPERWEAPSESLNWHIERPLSFSYADEITFSCLALAREAGRTLGTLPCAMNAANEIANAAFRRDACGFNDIARIVEKVMDTTHVEPVHSLEQLYDVDAQARIMAERFLKEL